MSDIHENFCAEIAAALVVPRRNIGRGLRRVVGDAETPVDLKEAAHYLQEAYDGIRYVEGRIQAEETRIVHTCSCGHTHYAHGDEA